PEVESVVGKSGRADTPTDPAPLDTVETFVNFRPRELWPRRAMAFAEASRQGRAGLAALEGRGYGGAAGGARDRARPVSDATMGALSQFDDAMRSLALRRYREYERELGPALTRCAVEETVRRFREAGELDCPQGVSEPEEVDRLAKQLAPEHGPWLA